MSIQIFDKMLNEEMVSVTVVNNNDKMIFKTKSGKIFTFLHHQNCCENVYIEDICGNLSDLIESPMLMAEEVDNLDIFNGPIMINDLGPHLSSETDESHIWTFYKFGTAKGTVTVRWLGISNGYYSENVDCIES